MWVIVAILAYLFGYYDGETMGMVKGKMIMLSEITKAYKAGYQSGESLGEKKKKRVFR